MEPAPRPEPKTAARMPWSLCPTAKAAARRAPSQPESSPLATREKPASKKPSTAEINKIIQKRISKSIQVASHQPAPGESGPCVAGRSQVDPTSQFPQTHHLMPQNPSDVAYFTAGLMHAPGACVHLCHRCGMTVEVGRSPPRQAPSERRKNSRVTGVKDETSLPLGGGACPTLLSVKMPFNRNASTAHGPSWPTFSCDAFSHIMFERGKADGALSLLCHAGRVLAR